MKRLALMCIAGMWLLSNATGHAEIIGHYPGLDALTSQSQIVAVVRIETRAIHESGRWLREDKHEAQGRYDVQFGTRCGIYGQYFCKPVRMLKGAEEVLNDQPIALCLIGQWVADDKSKPLPKRDGLTDLDRRILRLANESSKNAAALRRGDYALVFLSTTPNQTFPSPIPWSINCSGSVIMISPTAAQKPLKGTRPAEQAKELLQAWFHELDHPANKSDPPPRSGPHDKKSNMHR
jgi:hypothetical protein